MSDSFLKRWSRRKAGEDVAPEKEVQSVPEVLSQGGKSEKGLSAQAEDHPPLMTMDDVAKIDKLAPDFSAFMRSGVDPAVQQAALKKMFSDPHFNVMDRLDIYIDDYSQPDPLPIEMLKRLVQSDMLQLFQKEIEGDVVDSAKVDNPPLASMQPLDVEPSDVLAADVANIKINKEE